MFVDPWLQSRYVIVESLYYMCSFKHVLLTAGETYVVSVITSVEIRRRFSWFLCPFFKKIFPRILVGSCIR